MYLNGLRLSYDEFIDIGSIFKNNMRRGIMSTATQKIQTGHIVNGVDTDRVLDLAGNMQQDENYGKFKFRATNRWIDGAHSRSAIQGFLAGGEENTGREEPHYVDADQPYFLAGENNAPNPVEYVLHALDSCLTVTLVSHAAVQGIDLEKVETSSEGDMDARGFFGISDKVNKGYERIRVNMRVKSDADVETLTKLAMYSPVYEMVSKAIPVDFTLTKI
jgi:uncharacterized OsmC-like protein